MEDRRKYPRRALAVSLEILSGRTKVNLARGFITNLSEGGLAMETPKDLHPGERFLFRFSLPDDRTLDLSGEVVYAKDGVFTRAYGTKFHGLPPEAGGRLKEFVSLHPEQ